MFSAKAAVAEPPKPEVVVERVKTRLQELASEPDGLAKMDAMVDAIGAKASTAAQRSLVAEALKVRFNIEELSGDLSTKALPRLYKVFSMVPEAHVRDNAKLTKVIRNSRVNTGGLGRLKDTIKTEGGLGFYRDSGTVILNIPKVGIPFYRKDATGTRNVYEAFSFTTLHEIGHAVDAKMGFMNSAQRTSTAGAWREETAASVAAVGVEHRGLAKAFPEFGRASLNKFLEQILSDSTPAEALKKLHKRQKAANDKYASAVRMKERVVALAKEFAEMNTVIVATEDPEARSPFLSKRAAKWRTAAGSLEDPLVSVVSAFAMRLQTDASGVEGRVDAILADLKAEAGTAVPKGTDERLLAHPALAWANSLRLRNGFTELWDDGDLSAEVAVEGRVYQEAYKDKWWSYQLSARKKMLTGYQFRAPGEWFAELYACFYLKTPASHPHYSWFSKLVHEGGFKPPTPKEP